MRTTEKIVAYVEGQPIPEPTECYAVRGEGHIIDVIHPITGLTVCFGRTLENVREEKGYEHAERMTIEDWCKSKAERQDTPVTWSQVTEDKYYEMFECLPPIMIPGKGFMVSEPWDHHALTGRPRYAAYRKRGDVYETASRPMTVKEFKEGA